MKIPVNEVTDWNEVVLNFDILEAENGVKGKLAGFDEAGKPYIVWAKDGIGFNDLSSQVKLAQAQHSLAHHPKRASGDVPSLEKTSMQDSVADFNLDLPTDNDDAPQTSKQHTAEVSEFNPKQGNTEAKAKPGRKKDTHKLQFKLQVPDVAKTEPNKYVQSVCTVTVTETDTDKAVTSKDFRMLRCGVPGLTELAYMGLQTVLNRATRRKAPAERVTILEGLLERLEAGDVGVLHRKARRASGRRKAPMISVEVQAIAMARGWAIPPVAENWAKATEEQREKILQQPDIAAKLAELREAQGESGTDGMDKLFG